MSLIRNRATEKDLRDWFSKQGWDGKSGSFEELELIAIQRPGWLQVFRFQATMLNENDEMRTICGYCRDDERARRFDVEYRESFEDLNMIFAEWTSGLVTRNPQEWHPLKTGLMLLFVSVVIFLVFLLAVNTT